ncbi:hypothetical protein GGR56DRAFT_657450 [Xylariaceae sp. FL0804]|nr:hypothetical protein GGR56DRAFT_657450 [Xylariaceae sp. FL0804]
MSDQPLLGNVQGHGPRDRRRGRRSKRREQQRGAGAGRLFLSMFRSGLVAPSATTYDSMRIILNTADGEERDELTRRWMEHKLEELNFVGVVGGLLSGCLTSTGAWPDVLSNGQDKPWIVKACWYSGIIFAVFAVLTAAQQGLRLHRLSGHRDGLVLVRRCMAADGQAYHDDDDDDDAKTADNNGNGGGDNEDGRDDEIRPRRLQVYAWQASLAFLVGAVVCLIVGIMILVWVSADYGPKKRPEEGWWDDSSLLALVFTIVVVVSTFAFVVVQSALATGGVRDKS